MNRTGHQLAAIETRLEAIVTQDTVDRGLNLVLADCQRKLQELQLQYQVLYTSELKFHSSPTSDFQASLAEWLNDKSILNENNQDEDAEFSTLDGYLLVEDVAMLEQFVNQLDLSMKKLDTTTNFLGGSANPSTICTENPTMVS